MSEELGSMEQEAAKLLRALRDRLATDVHDPTSTCCVCPVCKLIEGVRDVDTDRLAQQASGFVTALLEALKKDVAGDREPPTGSRVEHVDIVDESA